MLRTLQWLFMLKCVLFLRPGLHAGPGPEGRPARSRVRWPKLSGTGRRVIPNTHRHGARGQYSGKDPRPYILFRIIFHKATQGFVPMKIGSCWHLARAAEQQEAESRDTTLVESAALGSRKFGGNTK